MPTIQRSSNSAFQVFNGSSSSESPARAPLQQSVITPKISFSATLIIGKSETIIVGTFAKFQGELAIVPGTQATVLEERGRYEGTLRPLCQRVQGALCCNNGDVYRNQLFLSVERHGYGRYFNDEGELLFEGQFHCGRPVRNGQTASSQ